MVSWSCCVNVFKFFKSFNLFFFALTLSQEVNHSFKACDWLLITYATLLCAQAPLTQDQAWVDRESWWLASWYQQSRIGLVWFCQLKTNPVTLSCSGNIMVHAPAVKLDEMFSWFAVALSATVNNPKWKIQNLGHFTSFACHYQRPVTDQEL